MRQHSKEIHSDLGDERMAKAILLNSICQNSIKDQLCDSIVKGFILTSETKGWQSNPAK